MLHLLAALSKLAAYIIIQENWIQVNSFKTITHNYLSFVVDIAFQNSFSSPAHDSIDLTIGPTMERINIKGLHVTMKSNAITVNVVNFVLLT